MKKFLLFFGILIYFNCAYASNSVSFIYINGSNNNNVKMKTWYEKGVKKLHPYLRKKFLNNSDIIKYYKNEGGLNIKEEPVIFFWGYDSKNDLAYVENKLELSKMVSSSGAYLVRNLITQFLHDAIWVQKTHNMLPVIEDLNETVKAQTKEGNSVLLYGYSAGTFVTYQYLFNKLRYVNLQNLFQTLNMNSEFMEFVKENPKKDTCISALSYSKGGFGAFTSRGHLVITQDEEKLKQLYLNIDDISETFCAPEGKIAGAVNFASPLPLFYSDISDPKYELTYYNKLMTKYILEHGIALITINFKEDPLGFPSNRNLTISEFEKILDMEIVNSKGIIYDNSSVWSKRLFPFAHTAYWSAKRSFSNAIVKSLVEGYKFQYDEKYQKKVIRQNRRQSEL